MDKSRLEKLNRAFTPKCVVVVGAKKDNNCSFLRSVSTLKGNYYSVQIDPNEIPGIEELGIKNFSGLSEIHEPIDYVICAVPRAISPRIVADCIKNDVAAVTLYTSGFAETQTEDGIRLSKDITEMANAANLNLIGPNCMGIFNPSVGLRFGAEQYTDAKGPVGFISQSGSNASGFVQSGYLNGVYATKVVSFGNGYVLDAADFLEYFALDEDTKIIGAYIEGVPRWRPFFDTLKEVTKKKPVIIWKGGRTGVGARMTSSHTGSLAVDSALWDAAMRQCGVIQASNLEQLIDVAKALIHVGPFTGTGMALTGGAGGQSVAIADAFADAGLEVPMLSKSSYEKIASFFVLIGSSFNNPIDMGQNRREFIAIMDILAEDENIDAVVMQMSFVMSLLDPQRMEETIATLLDFKEKSKKPLILAMGSNFPPEQAQAVYDLELRFREHGIPAYPSFERAALAIKKLTDYYKFHTEEAKMRMA